MLENGIGSLGIMSDEGEDVVGIITKTDLVKDFAENRPSKKNGWRIHV